MSGLIELYGKVPLKPLLLLGAEGEEERRRAATLPKIVMSPRELGDLLMLGIGGFSPLLREYYATRHWGAAPGAT